MLLVGSLNRSSILLFLGNLGSEVLVFVFSELVVRFIIPSPNTRTERLKLLVIQGSLLSVAVLLLHIFHRRPLLLALVVIFIFIRIISVFSQPVETSGSGRHVSKPLRKNVTVEPAVPLQWSHLGQDSFGGDVEKQQRAVWPQTHGHSSLVHRHATTGAMTTQPVTYGRSIVPHVLPTANTGYPTKRILPNQMSRGSFGRLNSHSSELSRNSLQRTSVGDATPHVSQSGSQQQGYLEYVSSFWGRSKPSLFPPGIYNSGNVCFAISTLKALTWTPGFVKHLKTVCQQKKKTVSPPSEKMQLLESLCSVLSRCHVLPDGTTSFSPISSSAFLKTVSEMVPYLVAPPHSAHRQTQQDASEFLLWLLDNLEGDGSSTHLGSSNEELSTAQKAKEECLLHLEGANSEILTTYREPLTQLAKADWLLESQKASFLTHEFFLGQMVEARECQNCKKFSVNVEYFTLLPLPIPETHTQLTLVDCFNSFGTVEKLTESNMMACSCAPGEKTRSTQMEEGDVSCGQMEGDQQVKGGQAGGEEEFSLTEGKRLVMLSRPPKRLVVQLSRFSYNPLRKCAQKNSTPITVPLTLDLSPYLMETKLQSAEKTASGTKSLYTLYAVCIHTGAQSTSFGHYLAYCRASNGTWYCFNDSYVSVVERIEQELQDSLLLQNAYLLLYSVAEDVE